MTEQRSQNIFGLNKTISSQKIYLMIIYLGELTGGRGWRDDVNFPALLEWRDHPS